MKKKKNTDRVFLRITKEFENIDQIAYTLLMKDLSKLYGHLFNQKINREDSVLLKIEGRFSTDLSLEEIKAKKDFDQIQLLSEELEEYSGIKIEGSTEEKLSIIELVLFSEDIQNKIMQAYTKHKEEVIANMLRSVKEANYEDQLSRLEEFTE